MLSSQPVSSKVASTTHKTLLTFIDQDGNYYRHQASGNRLTRCDANLSWKNESTLSNLLVGDTLSYISDDGSSKCRSVAGRLIESSAGVKRIYIYLNDAVSRSEYIKDMYKKQGDVSNAI